MAGCAFHPTQRSGDNMSFLARKPGHFGRKMEGENIGIWRIKSDSFPVSAVFSSVHLRSHRYSSTHHTHPSEFPFDMHIFQELYLLCASFHARRLSSSLGPADGILRGSQSFYFIDQPVQLQMAAASIFLLWLFNVALPGSIGGLLQIFRKSYS